MMKKAAKYILIALCAIAVLYLFVFRVNRISLGEGKQTVVYFVPFGKANMGGSAQADLCEQLEEHYGQKGVPTKVGSCQWDGTDAVVYDTADYQFYYLGKNLNREKYASCRVEILRTVVSAEDESVVLAQGTHSCTYIGWDDANLHSEKRAEILWDTKEEAYAEDEAFFNGLAQGR